MASPSAELREVDGSCLRKLARNSSLVLPVFWALMASGRSRAAAIRRHMVRVWSLGGEGLPGYGPQSLSPRPCCQPGGDSVSSTTWLKFRTGTDTSWKSAAWWRPAARIQSTQIGCAIVGPAHEIRSTGYNRLRGTSATTYRSGWTGPPSICGSSTPSAMRSATPRGRGWHSKDARFTAK